jgi:hypothetical protein
MRPWVKAMLICLALFATSLIGEDVVLQIEGKEVPKEVKKGVILRFQVPLSSKDETTTWFHNGLLGFTKDRTVNKFVDGQQAKNAKIFKEIETLASGVGDAEMIIVTKSDQEKKTLTYKFKIIE